jgi:hypothetical protein
MVMKSVKEGESSDKKNRKGNTDCTIKEKKGLLYPTPI